MVKKSKKQAIKIHFKNRCFERLGVSATKADIDEMKHDIRKNKAKFLERKSRSRTLWLIERWQQEFVAVYDNNKKDFVTCYLPGEQE